MSDISVSMAKRYGWLGDDGTLVDAAPVVDSASGGSIASAVTAVDQAADATPSDTTPSDITPVTPSGGSTPFFAPSSGGSNSAGTGMGSGLLYLGLAAVVGIGAFLLLKPKKTSYSANKSSR